LPRPRHYTEEPSRLCTITGAAFVRVQGSGFVTREMLEQTVAELRQGSREARSDALLVDLRAVAGYESACLLVVRQFLREAPKLGVHRVAVVATSSVLRTASRLAAHTVAVELRTFEHERGALQWVHPTGVATPRPRASSSSSSAAAAVP
jgi:ABC-type transporter Mla MlaB component